MGWSSTEGKDWTRRRVVRFAAGGALSVLDVGPGDGQYARLLAGEGHSRLVAFETNETDVALHHLRELYDEVVVGNPVDLDWPEVDVVLIGETAEQFRGAQARRLWDKAALAARRAVYVSVPLRRPQPWDVTDGTSGQPYRWDHVSVLDTLPGVGDWWLGDEVGVYERRVDGGGSHA